MSYMILNVLSLYNLVSLKMEKLKVLAAAYNPEVENDQSISEVMNHGGVCRAAPSFAWSAKNLINN